MAGRRAIARDLAALALTSALGLSALASGSPGVSQAMFTLLVVALLVSVLAARFGDPRRRPRAWGFAAFGVTYLALTYGLFAEPERRNLMTTFVLDRLQPRLRPAADGATFFGP